MATLEHLFDKFDPRRYKDYKNKFKVLACYKCNSERGRLHQSKIPVDALKERVRMGQVRKKGVPRPLYFNHLTRNQ